MSLSPARFNEISYGLDGGGSIRGFTDRALGRLRRMIVDRGVIREQDCMGITVRFADDEADRKEWFKDDGQINLLKTALIAAGWDSVDVDMKTGKITLRVYPLRAVTVRVIGERASFRSQLPPEKSAEEYAQTIALHGVRKPNEDGTWVFYPAHRIREVRWPADAPQITDSKAS